jgi:hypothetical protein
MNKIHEWVNTGLIVAVGILLLVGGNQSAPSSNSRQVTDGSLGGFEYVTNFDALELSKGQLNIGSTTQIAQLKVGVSTTGKTFTKMAAGLCYIYPYAATITASSTATVDCQATSNASGGGGAGALAPLTGVTANDIVVANLSTTTAGTAFPGLQLIGVGASTTDGYITLRLLNISGGAFTWPTNTNASGTAYYWNGK